MSYLIALYLFGVGQVCPGPILIALQPPLHGDDFAAYITAQSHCGAENECLVKFEKLGDHAYRAICGVR